MKVFIASLVTETNSFASIPTGPGSFEEYGIYRGDGSIRAPEGPGAYLAYFKEFLEPEGHEIIESMAAYAEPAGVTSRTVYEQFRSDIIDDLKRAQPVDAVILMLHGAMIADGYDDCEGDLLRAIRAVVGPSVPIGAELDLHCHATPAMFEAADALICFKEYPHIDGRDRARELSRIIIDTAEGRIRPVTVVADCQTIGLFPTTKEPMISFVSRMKAQEAAPVLSISLAHGFPWGDTEDTGVRLWVIADRDEECAERVAMTLASEFTAIRNLAATSAMVLDEALDWAAAVSTKPAVLADIADNSGGGAASDSTFILKEIIARGMTNVMIGAFWDPGAVQLCVAGGVGAKFALRIGGKCGPASGEPIDLRVMVRGLSEAHSQRSYDGRVAFGASAWVETETGVHILLTTIRSQVIGTDAFTGLGMEPESMDVVVVKSTQHFHAEFSRISTEIRYVATPGALNTDIASLPYRKRNGEFWPKVADTKPKLFMRSRHERK